MTKIGVLGGGQLGLMMIPGFTQLGVQAYFLDPGAKPSVRAFSNQVTQGDFNQAQTVYEWGKDLDIVTIEIEHVSVEGLKQLETKGVTVYPRPETIAMIQDKGLQKQFLVDHNIPTSPFTMADQVCLADISKPVVQKTRTGGYDGMGVKILTPESEDTDVLPGPSILEEPVNIKKELAIMVARNENGETITYPLVEMVFDPELNLIDYLMAPADISAQQEAECESIALDLAEKMNYVGVMAVELFLNTDGQILVNEMAPRPHNSGHHTIQATSCSQFTQHVRSIMNLPLGKTKLIKPAAMLNVIGNHSPEIMPEAKLKQLLALGDVFYQSYHKPENRPKRKMGHITVMAESVEELKDKIKTVKEIVSEEVAF